MRNLSTQSLSSLTIALVTATWLAGPTIRADTKQDFDNDPTLGQHANPPAATILPGGPSGNFLRLTHNTANPPNLNTLDFDLTDPGAHCRIEASWDFRIIPGTGRADGFGFALLNTSTYGTSGTVAPPPPFYVPEEPSFLASLGIGFDIYQNVEIGDIDNNNVSIHGDGALIDQANAGPVDLANGQFIGTRLIVEFDAVGAYVTVILTPEGGLPATVFNRRSIPGLKPYEARTHFGARSGGLAADHDFDNILVIYSDCAPSVTGSWGELKPWPVVSIHAHLLPNGKVMFWDRHDYGDGDPRLWDPETDTITFAAPLGTNYDIFCSGHSFLADGSLFVTGGHDHMDSYGLRETSVYNPFTDSWTVLPLMNNGRWYPTSTTLANGDVLVVSGEITPGVFNDIPQVWEASAQAWRDLTNAPRLQPLYPFMFLAPNGKVFDAGPVQSSHYLDTSGSGAWTAVATSQYGYRDYGSAVMYDDGKILLVGGSRDTFVEPPTASAEVIDLTQPTPVWRAVSPMHYPRRQLNTTALPDGKVLATGGTGAVGFSNATGAVLISEMWDPESETWTLGAAQSAPRLYHSVALLLPDGRVLSTGGGHPRDAAHAGRDRFDAQVYSPPYLFLGPRPAITAAPSNVTYGESFTVDTPDGATIQKVSWIRLSSVTHAFNQNQRMSFLPFQTVTGGVQVTAPGQATLSPPGHYMLFLVDQQGVPSIAHLVRIE